MDDKRIREIAGSLVGLPLVGLEAAVRNLLSEAIVEYKEKLERWKEYAQHQEICAVCAEAVKDCEEGTRLQAAARKSESEHG